MSHELHSVMVKRHGETVASGWWAPYRADAVHSLYSLSKSVTSTGVAEGRLKVSDRVTCRFDGEQAQIQFMNNITTLSGGSHIEVRPILKGRIV